MGARRDDEPVTRDAGGAAVSPDDAANSPPASAPARPGGEATPPASELREVGQEGFKSVAQATDPTTDDPFVELGLVDHDRWVAPGGWRRGLIGFAVGAAAGWLVTVAHRGDARAHKTGHDPHRVGS